ncbi:hypothetical protein TPHA_0L01310 [Tetrapisispora phaffii CBS 4417]|uniref:Nascent polypeptide-associated complex subunit beta n=1 Tax=Tetrapisispora phaffii (strain ATCC 24235 / CBS 4417 / NBRC 1672 / NRRL Y-8282 / UCD 70-5) TaxID=1071381 RepID=G8C008_TETPH|nr:hypothetical protein TPHA_0L01310 [Tetrapisispora phaffii CBS 4417]CCE65486.1 hypothetical protein TPHA_0L01310 [Tetrapisispora phaffii CBS 4417]
MPVDQEKLAKLQKLSAKNKVGGTRRKQVKKSAGGNKDDSKLQVELGKYKAVTIDNVAEANFFKNDGNVLHFNKVGVQVADKYNTSVFYGLPQEKSLQDLFPNIISQLGSDSINALTQLASQLQVAEQAKAAAGAENGDVKDESIPELVEGQSFDADVE